MRTQNVCVCVCGLVSICVSVQRKRGRKKFLELLLGEPLSIDTDPGRNEYIQIFSKILIYSSTQSRLFASITLHKQLKKDRLLIRIWHIDGHTCIVIHTAKASQARY